MNTEDDLNQRDDPFSAIDVSYADVDLEPFDLSEAIQSTAENAFDFLPVHPDSVKVEILAGSILLSLLVVGGTIGLAASWMFFQFNWIFWVGLGVGMGLLLLAIFSSFFWPPIHYRHIRYRLNEQSLEIHRGVFWKHRISIPLGRVQHADVSQGPLQRVWSLATLTVHTAGTLVPSISLEGLEHSDAINMRDDLVRQTRDSQTV